jgi:phosphoribosylanthranilate isomerase
MTWVKICGTTNLEDALTAVNAGADAVGFVFCEESPRNISVEAAREIVEQLPGSIEKIGVFVDNGLGDPVNVVFQTGLTGLQSYSSIKGGTKRNSLSFVRQLDPPKYARFLVALPMSSIFEDESLSRVPPTDFANVGKILVEFSFLSQGLIDTFLLDSGELGRPGGTGKTFNWEKVVPIAQEMRQGGVRLVVAGGLTPENVAEAMGILKPWGVDVASGVEASPGKKDPEKVRAFVKAVRENDRNKS